MKTTWTIDEPVVCDHFSGDWYALHTERGMKQINGASVEGTSADMLGMAAAIESRSPYTGSEGRCRVAYDPAERGYLLASPRNSMSDTLLPERFGPGLAASIRTEVARVRALPPEPAWHGDDPEGV